MEAEVANVKTSNSALTGFPEFKAEKVTIAYQMSLAMRNNRKEPPLI